MLGGIFSAQELDLFVRLITATILGWVIGLERETLGKTAGTRTFALVSLGSALFAIASNGGVQPIAAGIGFLGAGLIIFKDGRAEGLTTAAALWAAAALGTMVGQGQYRLGILAAVLIVIVLFLLRWVHPEEWGKKT